MYYVYILKLVNGQYYIGFTHDLKARVKKHNASAVKTTARIKVEQLVFYAGFRGKMKALKFEKYLKSSSGFAFRNKRLV